MPEAKCEMCPDEHPFVIPWDEIGAVLMTAHLEDAHGLVRVAPGQFEQRGVR